MNIYQEVQSLQKSPIETGGLCSIAYFKWEDVEVWPSKNPQTGIITSAIQMKAGKEIFICQAVDKGRSLEEEEKSDAAGSFMNIEVTGILAGTNTSNILSLEGMRYHRWGLIVKDRSGHYRLIGDKDSGAKFSYKYTSADGGGSRLVRLQWAWDNPLSAPVYQSQTFTITIGGVTVVAGSLKLIIRFKVGQPGAPMADGDSVYINAAMANKQLLILANGLGVPQDDGSGDIDWMGSIERHVEKTLASNQITWVGGVNQDEIIEIYEIS